MIYLDSAATTKPSPEVLETFVKVNEQFFANPHALHNLGIKAEALLEQSRKQILSLLTANSYNLLFTGSATEANNLAIRGIVKRYAQRGKHIITSATEHPSVYTTCESLREEGFEVTILPVTSEGIVSPESLKDAMREDTILVSLMAVNNEVGALNDYESLGSIVKEHSGAKFHVDAVQLVGKLPLSLKKSTIDLLTLSAHKFHGLKGCGALVLKKGLSLVPQITGGDQEDKQRAGTADIASAASMAKALRLSIEPIDENLKRVATLQMKIRKALTEIAGVTINTPEKHSSPYILNLSVEGVKPETMLHALAEKQIFISTISACSAKNSKESRPVYAMTGSHKLATTSIRISLNKETTEAEIESFITTFKQLITTLR